jgi:hypothetical protein
MPCSRSFASLSLWAELCQFGEVILQLVATDRDVQRGAGKLVWLLPSFGCHLLVLDAELAVLAEHQLSPTKGTIVMPSEHYAPLRRGTARTFVVLARIWSPQSKPTPLQAMSTRRRRLCSVTRYSGDFGESDANARSVSLKYAPTT